MNQYLVSAFLFVYLSISPPSLPPFLFLSLSLSLKITAHNQQSLIS